MQKAIILSIAVLFLQLNSTSADFLIEGFTATDYNETGNWNGFGFTANSNIDVTGFAIVDIGTLGLAGNATVGLWSVNSTGTAVNLIGELNFTNGPGETLVAAAAVPAWTTSGLGIGEEFNGFVAKELGTVISLVSGNNYILGVAPTTQADAEIPYYQQVTGSSPPLSNLAITINSNFTLLSGAGVIPQFDVDPNSPNSFGLSGTPPMLGNATSDPTQRFPGASTSTLFNPIIVNLVTGDFDDLPQVIEPMPGVPEPSSMILMGMAVLGGTLVVRRRQVAVA